MHIMLGRKPSPLSTHTSQRLPNKSHSAIPSIIVWLLYITITLFYFSNIYSTTIASYLIALKWIALFALFVALIVIDRPLRIIATSGNLSFQLIVLCAVAGTSVCLNGYLTSELFAYFSVILGLSTAILLTELLVKQNSTNLFFDATSNVGSIIIVISFIMVRLDINLGRGDYFGRFSGWSDNPNTLALIIAPTIVILTARILERRNRWFYLRLFVLTAGIYVILRTGSRAGIGWIGISTFAFIFVRVSLQLKVFVLTAFILILSISSDFLARFIIQLSSRETSYRVEESFETALSGRSEVWAIGIDLFKDAPYFGYGTGSSQLLLEERSFLFLEHQGLHFHSSYLTSLVEIGLIGTILMLLPIVTAVIKGFRRIPYYRAAPINIWPKAVLPWALLLGALGHATVESWLLAAGNANMILFWFSIALIFSSSQSRSRVFTQSNAALFPNRSAQL